MPAENSAGSVFSSFKAARKLQFPKKEILLSRAALSRSA
jgi:hypothetical protein